MATLQGTIAAVQFILTNAAKHDVDDVSLVQEIQQLGLPKENSDVIGKLYKEKKDELRVVFASYSYAITKVLKTDWRVDSVVATSNQSTAQTTAHIKFLLDVRPQDAKVVNNDTPVDGFTLQELAFEISPEKLDVLIYELSRAKSYLDTLEG